MATRKKNIPSYHIINMAGYTSPSIVEQTNKDWVEYGEDNNYYQYLIDLYYSSPTNNACIKGKSDMIYGYGPEVVKADRHLKGYLDFKTIFQNEEVKKCVMDLTMLGMCAFQIVKSKDGKKYVKAYHFPMQTLRPQKANDKGEIEKWYYCADWSKLKKGQKPKEFAAFGYDESAKECMLVIKPYSTGNFYFSPPDYQGGTQYCELEGEISNYHLNNIKNGLAPSMLINFNNGEPSEEIKDAIEAQINAKFGGSSNTGRAIVSFNESKDSAADITPVALSDAADQYQFLSTECIDKILLAHRITSPLLFGVKNSGNGFSSNAEELKTASILFDNIVIRPFQNLLIDAFNKVLLKNEVMVDIYFKTLQPLEFVDLSGVAIDTTTKEKEYGFSKVEMVEKKSGESKDEFLGRCIKYVINEGKSNEQAYAICINKWNMAAENKVSFDFDDTLSTDRGQELAKKEIENGATVFVISARDSKDGMLDIASEIGIPASRVYAAGSNQAKVEKIKELGIEKHYDNNSDVIKALGSIGIQFSKPKMTEEDENAWLAFLQDKGEEIDLNEWEVIDIQEANDDDDHFEFGWDNPDMKSKDDTGIFKIRYKYGPDRVTKNSRKFCKEMTNLSKKGIVYRREDINMMSFNGVNGQFAPEGSSNYSIWKFKGGVYCHHAWYRVTYRRKTEGGKIKPLTPSEKNSGERDMRNYEKVSDATANREGVPFAPPSWDTASTKTIDLPNRGSLKNK
jgi:hypothetical protein